MVMLFFSLFLSVVASTHYYFFAFLVRDSQLPVVWTRFFGGLLTCLPVAIILMLVVGRRLALNSFSQPLMATVYFWMGGAFCLLWVSATTQAFFKGLQVLVGTPPLFPGLPALVAVSVASLLSFSAWRTASLGPRVVPVEVRLARLPASLAGIRVVQLSDLHVAPLLGRAYIENVVAKTMALRPDLIAITGDLVDGEVATLREAIAPLADLRARFGVFAVTGNHEYYSGADAWIAHFTALGIRVLRNERVSIGTDEGTFDLAGIDDATAGHFGGDHGPRLDRAVFGRDAKRELILLAHQPKQVVGAAREGVGLMLSGHTHGGQLFPFGLLVRLAQPFVSGLHRVGETQVYVNRGTGYWGPPMRLGAPPEITLLTLQPGAAG